MSTAAFSRRHPWTFFRAGGLDQVRFETADDLRHIGKLDLKLWVALSCPVRGVEFDRRTLELIDQDKDGRVRAPEIITAVNWVCSVLKHPTDIMKSKDGLLLSAIDDSSVVGKALFASAKQVLMNLGKSESDALTVAETSDTVKIFANTLFNGDGVIIPEAASDEHNKQLIRDIIIILGAVLDRSGKPGIDKAKADVFFAEVDAYSIWLAASQGVLPLGDGTPAAFAAFAAVKNKIADYFARCRLAAYDHRAASALNRAESEYLAFAAKDLSIDTDEVVGLPLQRIEPRKPLFLTEPMNPAWTAKITNFIQAVMTPLLGAEKNSINDVEWTELCARFAGYESWLGSKKGALVEKLGVERIRAIIANGGRNLINDLLARDLAVAAQVAGIDSVDRLVRYHRDLFTLLNNFVNFSDFYDPKQPAIFQVGTLYLDQRSCDLCIQVDDAVAHSTLGNLGKIYIAYCLCTRVSGEKMTIAAAFTQGDSDYLMVGRNGLFYDRSGRDWDATIIKLLDHPISIRQAFWSPYKKIGKMISETIEKIAGDADKSVMEKAGTTVATSAHAAQVGKPVEKAKIDTGMLAAIGIAGTTLIGAISGIAASIFGLPPWKIPLVFIGVVLAVSGPAMIIAALKLRQRTLGPILEGTGWAINGRVKINFKLGSLLTGAKKLPAGSKRLLDDPFVDEHARRRRNLIIVLIIVALIGFCYWQRAWLKMQWDQFVNPTPPTTVTATATVTTPAAAPAPAPQAPKN